MHRILVVLLLAVASQTVNAFPTYATGGFRGANLMSSDEVKEHVAHLLSMQTMPECQAYMDTHELLLQKRALEQHATLPEKGGDPCKVMRFMGRIK